MSQSADFLAGLGAEPERAKPQKKIQMAEKSKVSMDPEHDFSLTDALLSLAKRYSRELVVASGVMALVGTALVNAIYLQESKHPAPLFAGGETDQISPVTTAAIPKPREIFLEKSDRPPAADPLVAEIQRHLTARGYYNAEIDGLMGARTRAAIGLYQRSVSATVTNEASRALLEHIRLSVPDKEYHAKARERVAEAEKKAEAAAGIQSANADVDHVINDPLRIKQVQQALSRLGYDLVADGVVGRNTRLAIAEFKEQHGLKGEDLVTLALYNELIKLKKL